MGRNGHRSWDDGQVMGLATQVLDGGPAGGDPSATSSAGRHRPAELSLADVVDAGRAAFVWLDALVILRHVSRDQGSAQAPGASAGTDHRDPPRR
jgi:hypothetical protein